MKKILAFACIFSYSIAYSQTFTFEGCYSLTTYSSVTAIASMANGGYYIGFSSISEEDTSLIIQFDDLNQEIFRYILPDGEIIIDDFFIDESNNDLYVLSHHNVSPQAPNGEADDICLIKLHNNQFVFEQHYGGSATDRASSIKECNSSSLIIAGSGYSEDGIFSETHGNGEGIVFIVSKLDGSITFSRLVGGSINDAITEAFPVDDGIILIGYSDSNDGDLASLFNTTIQSYANCFMMKMSLTGIILSGYTVDADVAENTRDSYGLKNRSWYVVGVKDNSAFTLQLNESGVVWEETFEDSILFNKVIGVDDGGCIIIGQKIGPVGSPHLSPIIVRYSQAGELLWVKYVGDGNPTNNSTGRAIAELPQDDFVVGGGTGSMLFNCPVVNLQNSWTARLQDDFSVSVEDVQSPAEIVLNDSPVISLIPNKTKGECVLYGPENVSQVSVYSISGQLVWTMNNVYLPQAIQFSLPSGMYSLVVDNKTLKFVIE